MTSSCEQATRWAKSVTKRRREGIATVTEFAFTAEYCSSWDVLKFIKPDGAWLDYVVQNRRAMVLPAIHDLVIGPVANDSTLQVIDDYMAGRYTREEAINHLLPQNLTDQYAFLSGRSLTALTFLRHYNV